MYILKSNGYYVVAGPRVRRSEGMLTSEHRCKAKTFESKEIALAWLDTIKCRQVKQGFKRHELARATVVELKGATQ